MERAEWACRSYDGRRSNYSRSNRKEASAASFPRRCTQPPDVDVIKNTLGASFGPRSRRDTGLEGHDIEKTIAARYGLGKDELEGNKEALMRRVNYKQHASKASRIFQSGPAWVG